MNFLAHEQELHDLKDKANRHPRNLLTTGPKVLKDRYGSETFFQPLNFCGS